MPRRLLALLIAVVGLVGAAAIVSALIPEPAFRAQAAAGSMVYTQTCLSCHGGPGGPGVAGRTEPLQGPRFAQRNPTALEIFDVVRSGREPNLRALTDDQLWAAIAAELLANGVDRGGQRLGFDNAATVPTESSPHVPQRIFFPPGR
ncbi:MAG: c-type cytochrome [Candidatus Dormibacteria bacterium]